MREMTEAMLMDVQRVSCWTLAEALGHSGPHRLQHFLSRAVWHHDAARDRLACWAVAELADDQAVLVVDETGDEKSSTDAVGASRQYSGALGGIGLCQVAVHLTYAAQSGHALIDRALYLARDWAGDDERRELAHVPGELCFATKPQLAAMLLERARDLGLPARWVAADEVYGGCDLRMRMRELGYDYTVAVPSGHYVTTRAGRFTAAALAARLPRRAWQRLKTGQGSKGDRHYDWAMIEVTADDAPPGDTAGHAFLLVRRHRYTRELSFCRCHSAASVALSDLVAVVCRRWRIEMVFTQLAKRAVRPVRGRGEHVADLDLAVGDDHPVDEQLGQQPALGEGGGGQPGADGLAECLDAVGDGLQFQPLSGGGVQLALLGRQGGAAAVQLVPLALEFG